MLSLSPSVCASPVAAVVVVAFTATPWVKLSRTTLRDDGEAATVPAAEPVRLRVAPEDDDDKAARDKGVILTGSDMKKIWVGPCV